MIVTGEDHDVWRCYLERGQFDAALQHCRDLTQREKVRPRSFMRKVSHAVRTGPVPSKPFMYRGTSLMRNRASLGTYSRTMPRALWWS